MVTAKEKDFSIMLKNSWGHSFVRLLTLLQTALDDAKQCSKRFDLKYTLTGLKLRIFFCWRRLHQLLKRLVIKPVTTHHIFNHAFLQTKYFEMVFPSHSMVTKRTTPLEGSVGAKFVQGFRYQCFWSQCFDLQMVHCTRSFCPIHKADALC